MSIERIEIKSKPELEKIILDELGHVEKGLTVICSNVPINDKTTLDVLCHDENGQLVVMQIAVDEDDDILLQGLQSLNHINNFKSMLKVTYAKHKIDDKAMPRLILVAPSFSETVRNAVKNMQGMQIDLYEWEYLKIGDRKGLRIQPIFASPKTRVKKPEPKKKAEPEEKPKAPKTVEKPEKKPETKKKTPSPVEPKPLKPQEPKPEPKPEVEQKAEKKEEPWVISPPKPAKPEEHREKPEKPKEQEQPKESPKKEKPKKKLKLF